MSRKRPWLAALLALFYPGLGHVYLRSWLRAVVWFLLALMTASLVMPESVATAYETGGFDAMVAAMQAVPLGTLAPILVVSGLCVLDAYVSARRDIAYGTEGESSTPENACPNCGKELEEDYDFCPWCADRIEPEEPTSR